MNLTNFAYRTSKSEVKIAKTYLFLLPFRMIALLEFLKLGVSVAANYVDFVFNVIGLWLWFVNEKGSFKMGSKEGKVFGDFAKLIIFLNISSFLMAIVIYSIYGDYAGESPFNGIWGMEIIFFQYLFMILYNIRVFTLISKDDIRRILYGTCCVLLVIAYAQVAVMLGFGGGIYDAIVAPIGGINTSNMLPKLCLTGAEGATAGCIMAVFVFPFLLSNIVFSKSRKYKIQFVLWLIPLFYTRSSTAYLLFATGLFVFFVYIIKNNLSVSLGKQNYFHLHFNYFISLRHRI